MVQWAIKNTTTGEILPERYDSKQMANVDCQSMRVMAGYAMMEGQKPYRFRVILLDEDDTPEPKLFG